MSKLVGTSAARLDVPAKATGQALYTADYSAPNLLHVALVRSPLAHGKILGIQIPPLEEDVYCYTAADLPSNVLPSIMNDQPVLASEKVRHMGEPIAIVAAPSAEQARAVAACIKVDFSPLELVEDMQAALSADSPRVFEAGNLCSEFHSEKGNLDQDFSKCALILEETFEMPIQAHGFLEPEAAFTDIDENGRLRLISSTQNAFADRDMVASVLQIPQEQVISRAATVGGGFGGKDGNTAQIFPAVVTHYTGRPSKYVFSREENIRYGMKRHNAIVYAKIGFSSEGMALAFRGKMWMDTGAYAILGPAVLGLGTEHMTGPYYIPSVKLDGWLAYTNHAPASAMRGFGAPQSAMAVECLMNQAANHFGLDPLEIRLRNAIHRGQSGPMGAVMEHSIGFEEALQMFKQSAFYQEMKHNPQPGVGYGIAAGMMSSGMGKNVPDTSTVHIEKLADDHYIVRVGLVDIGQGSETILAMIAADALKVPLSAIEMRMGNTEEAVDSGSTAASRTTYGCGNAIVQAAEKIRQGESRAEGICVFPEIPGDDGVHSMFAFIVQGVKLRLDPITGAVHLLNVYNVTEAGNIINPTMMAGQIFGGIAMSTGYTLSEQIRYQDGRSLETDFSSYIMPTALDAPYMVNENVPAFEETGPYGAKGIAEASTVALAPAITAAVKQLCPTLHANRLPLDREAILEALDAQALSSDSIH